MLLPTQFIICAVLCSLYFNFCVSCKIDVNDNFVMKCISLNELKDAGNHPEWNNLTIVNLENKEQVILPNDIFNNVPNLMKLNITGAVNRIEPFAFRGLDKLDVLHLENNNFEELPDIAQLKELTQFFVTNSKIKSIPENYFKNMPKLRFIKISNNVLTNIGNCAFCDLDNAYVILDNNSIKSFEPQRILGATSFIAGLNLDENHLTTVEGFGRMPNLAGATYINNSITHIESNSFSKAPKLLLLDVSFNEIEEIEANIFPENVRSDEPSFLVLHNNKIQCLSSEVRNKFKNLRRITVSDNPWHCDCLKEVTTWALKLKAFIGCDLARTCTVSCVDAKNSKNDIKFY